MNGPVERNSALSETPTGAQAPRHVVEFAARPPGDEITAPQADTGVLSAKTDRLRRRRVPGDDPSQKGIMLIYHDYFPTTANPYRESHDLFPGVLGTMNVRMDKKDATSCTN